MAHKGSRVEVQKGPIEPRDKNSENSKNMTRSQCDMKDYADRQMRRSGQEMVYDSPRVK